MTLTEFITIIGDFSTRRFLRTYIKVIRKLELRIMNHAQLKEATTKYLSNAAVTVNEEAFVHCFNEKNNYEYNTCELLTKEKCLATGKEKKDFIQHNFEDTLHTDVERLSICLSDVLLIELAKDCGKRESVKKCSRNYK